jgi:outer membrane lipoprotein SlyB
MLLLPVLALPAACAPDYSPNTYSTTAVQQANKVERGIVIGVRDIQVSAAGTTGAATGAAAGGAVGGVAGSQTPGALGTALGAIGGGVLGGLIGTSVEHATGDTPAYEYIVRKTNNDLVSVTQKDAVPLKIGTQVLVIAGNQARIVPDYTVDATQPPPSAATPPAPAPAEAPPPATPAAADTAPLPGTEPPPTPVAASPLPAPAGAPAPAPAATP